jgi:RNase H-like domain found in reverse transcriptase
MKSVEPSRVLAKLGSNRLEAISDNKELLAIVDSLEHYRHMFEGLGHQITIYSDHHNLLWFTETKIYNRRQARWAEKLSKYDFIIHFRPGKQGGKPDALSRRPDYVSENSIREPSPVLKPEQLAAINFAARRCRVPPSAANQGEAIGDADLRQAILEALERDPVAAAHRKSLVEGFSEDEGLLLKDGLVYVVVVCGNKCMKFCYIVALVYIVVGTQNHHDHHYYQQF